MKLYEYNLGVDILLRKYFLENQLPFTLDHKKLHMKVNGKFILVPYRNTFSVNIVGVIITLDVEVP